MKVKYEKGKYYKVVRMESNEYVSCIISRDPFMLHYSLGKITWAPLTTVGILIFDSLIEASGFVKNQMPPYNSYILRGKAIKPIKMMPFLYYASNLEDLLNCKSQRAINHLCAYPPPIGTIAAPGFLPEEVLNG